jgi:hypothetical protein
MFPPHAFSLDAVYHLNTGGIAPFASSGGKEKKKHTHRHSLAATRRQVTVSAQHTHINQRAVRL